MRLNLLPSAEAAVRLDSLAKNLTVDNIDIAVIDDNATKYYLTGQVFAGQIIVMAREPRMECFVRRPNHLEGKEVHHVRKPEEIPALLPAATLESAKTVGFDFGVTDVATFNRLSSLFPSLTAVNSAAAVRATRAIKTPAEIDKIAQSGRLQTEVYDQIPSLFHPGMTDLQLQIEIERALRLKGCLGQFRIAGNSMELFMASILAGDNADNPTPYDFAMGGAGVDPSLPVGANNTVITPGTTVMVDANGNFTGYMTDMTRTFACGPVDDQAIIAHQLSIDICDAVARAARPGKKASALYELAIEMVDRAGLRHFFMGHRQQAGFIGHGVGIEINEAPVIAPRSRDIIQEGNVIAVEPKFVIPGVGAVGIENTYVVEADQTRCLTLAPTELRQLG